MPRVAALLVLAAGCSGSSAPPPPPTEPLPVHAAPLADAGTHAVPVEVVAPRPQARRPGKPIEIVLRSSPVISQVSVDGVVLGPTPQVWAGDSGAEHEFAFTADKYELARYRFVPITSGVIHARLEPLADEAHPQQPPREVMPQPQSPPSIVEPAPPIAIDAGEADAAARGPTLPF